MPTHTYTCAAFTLYTRSVCSCTQCHAMTAPVVCMCMRAYCDRKHNIQQAKHQNSTNINRSSGSNSSNSSRNAACASFVCVCTFCCYLIFLVCGSILTSTMLVPSRVDFWLESVPQTNDYRWRVNIQSIYARFASCNNLQNYELRVCSGQQHMRIEWCTHISFALRNLMASVSLSRFF